MNKKKLKIPEKKDPDVNDKKIADLNSRRIKKNVLNETVEEQHGEVEDFLKRFRDDTLTGL